MHAHTHTPFHSPSPSFNVVDMPLHLGAYPRAHRQSNCKDQTKDHPAYSCHYGLNNPGRQCIRLISLITCISLWGLDTPPLIKMMDGGIRGCSPLFQICSCLERCLLENTWGNERGKGAPKAQAERELRLRSGGGSGNSETTVGIAKIITELC